MTSISNHDVSVAEQFSLFLCTKFFRPSIPYTYHNPAPNPLHQQPPSAQYQRRRARANTHEPLQRTELHPFHPLPQPRHFLLDPRLRLLDLQFLPLRLLSDPPFLQVQVQPYRSLGAPDLVAKPRIELRDFVGEAFVGGEGYGRVGGVHGQELGAEFGEVDFLGVGAAVGVYTTEVSQ